MVLAAQTRQARWLAVNLGTGLNTRVIDQPRLVPGRCGSQSVIVYVPRRPWDRSIRHQADTSRTERVLGHTQSVASKDGVERTVASFGEFDADIRSSIESGR